jgi:hypothetical protein
VKIEQELFEKVITINDYTDRAAVLNSCLMLLDFMFNHSKIPEYFRLRLKDSERSPHAKDILLEWSRIKE